MEEDGSEGRGDEGKETESFSATCVFFLRGKETLTDSTPGGGIAKGLH